MSEPWTWGQRLRLAVGVLVRPWKWPLVVLLALGYWRLLRATRKGGT